MGMTVLYEIVKGKKIIIGFDKQYVDPIETENNWDRHLMDTELGEKLKAAYVAAENAKSQGAAYDAQQLYLQAYTQYQIELKRLCKEKPVYFPHAGRNEDPINDEDAQRLIMLLQSHRLVTIEGEILDDAE
jgi:hypothetical protein